MWGGSVPYTAAVPPGYSEHNRGSSHTDAITIPDDAALDGVSRMFSGSTSHITGTATPKKYNLRERSEGKVLYKHDDEDDELKKAVELSLQGDK